MAIPSINLIVNPTLSDLIGGVQTVTLSDEEAKRGELRSLYSNVVSSHFNIGGRDQERYKVAIHR